MKKFKLLTAVTGLCMAFPLQAQEKDVVSVYEKSLPILIERQDNEWFDIRMDADRSKVIDEVSLRFGDDVKLSEVESVKLYYGGTDRNQREGTVFFAPEAYIARDIPGKTLAAGESYSVLKAEVKSPRREVKFAVNQSLFPGVNYFWVSLQMKPTASILSKVTGTIGSVKIDGVTKPVKVARKATAQYMGVGVRHAGDDGVAAYRIPGLVTSNKGTLIGVYDIRYDNNKDLQNHIDIGVSRSNDGGQTWEKMRVAMTMGESDGLPKSQNGVGDPAVLVDKITGTIWIVAAWAHGMGGGVSWWNSMQGMDRFHTAQLMMVKSDDDGKTWSQPINVTPQVKDPSWYFLLQGPGRGITMKDGTIVFACQFIGADRVPNASIIYSKDHGKTWKIGTIARTNTTEAQVAELEPGTLMLNMRDNRGGSRAVAVTEDMGKTWKEHESSRTALREPVCMASLISVKSEDNILGRNILLFSNPDDTKTRDNITIKASLDGGETWLPDNQLLLDAGDGWGYSCLTMIDKETVGILYESSVAHMTFQAVKLKDIIRAK
jgi:sialidase-1